VACSICKFRCNTCPQGLRTLCALLQCDLNEYKLNAVITLLCTLCVQVDDEYSEEPLSFAIAEADGIELEDVKLANDEDMDTVDDLIQLPHLHEASFSF
jgi:hypothetical protein